MYIKFQDVYTLPCVKRRAMGSCRVDRELSLVLCDDLECWDGGRGWREAYEGGDICILTADSHCCTAKTNATL